MKNNTIKVLYQQANKDPQVVEIENKLEESQRLVDGYIEVLSVEESEDFGIALVCNDEGKLRGLPVTAALRSGMEVIDVICGDFFLVRENFDSGDFESLTDEEIERYTHILSNPDYFAKWGKAYQVVPSIMI